MSAGAAVAPLDRIGAALWWRDNASSAPEAAMRKAVELLSGPDGELRVLARHIAALAAVEQGRVRQAHRHARLGLAAARRAERWQLAAQLQLTLAWIEMERGDVDASWANLVAAEPRLPAAEQGRAACLRGLLHCQGDQHQQARVELTRALRSLRADDDRRWTANALMGRGLANLYSNRLVAAENDLSAAERVFAAGGQPARAAGCRHNRGCVAFRAGDLPRALRLFEEAVAAGLDVRSSPEALVDRAEALAAAGLATDARAVMEQAAERLAACGRAGRLADTRLALAGCALRADDLPAAVQAANSARRLFRAQRRPALAAVATAVAWQAKLRAGQCSRYALSAARRAAAACADSGSIGTAAELRLTAGRCAAGAGMRTASRKLFAMCAPLREAASAPPQHRALGWLAEALLAEQDDDLERLFEACQGGLRAVDSQLSDMVAFELRAHTAGLAAELGDLAVGAALRTGDPELVLNWTERSRASALHRRALRPPVDSKLNSALVRLRSAVRETRSTRGPLRVVAGLEEQVRHRAMLVEGRTSGLPGPCGLGEVSGVLGESALLSLCSHRGRLFAVSIVEGEVRLHVLGPEGSAHTQAARLRHLLSRQAAGTAPRAAPMFEHGARQAAEELQAQLLDPLLPVLGRKRPLVVIPTGRLHVLPWAALPACRGRSVTVAPSVRCWLRSALDARAADPAGTAVWIAGPGLDHAEREVRALHGAAGGRLLTGAVATTERVLSTVDGAAVVHIAAHGRFRDDQPLLSCLDLADGPLYAYDLDRLHRGPATVVLSACDVGRSAVGRGDQLSGLATTLLGRGTATVIASVVPVPDERTVDVMTSLHRSLSSGVAPAEALAAAQAEHGESGFVCLGYGGDR
ncbi:CHAT domain-containing protein [Saccharopolyspora antimicrobica]|uniref:CHAT domain-containing protein n=1 Tax=Saccharopolyspora antimicrobica TaxID=455193 RepID=A0A1I4QEB7_9PSEU|nr:CHAT domain-containing protein [Saccharopolyspora antimicrobica]RKT84883.1 CHAT domain-containing protein [Saccharopolyspora antimicrobica]SFM38000.1 CHAT domain-containing protein [Saccharopolyspora antimicrobica]